MRSLTITLPASGAPLTVALSGIVSSPNRSRATSYPHSRKAPSVNFMMFPLCTSVTDGRCDLIEYAIKSHRPSVTLVHKGNIMKFTEGAFREWGYEVARERFGDETIPESATVKGAPDAGKVIVKDRIADSMFQQVLLRPEEYSVLATPNLNGDYLSDACVAQIGGLGMAPGGNVGGGDAVFEATHGTAPKYAGLDKVDPGAVILSRAMMFEELGWTDAADAIVRGLSGAIAARCVTYDLARQMPGATEVSTSRFAECIIEHV